MCACVRVCAHLCVSIAFDSCSLINLYGCRYMFLVVYVVIVPYILVGHVIVCSMADTIQRACVSLKFIGVYSISIYTAVISM